MRHNLFLFFLPILFHGALHLSINLVDIRYKYGAAAAFGYNYVLSIAFRLRHLAAGPRDIYTLIYNWHQNPTHPFKKNINTP
jgi:hypothetical protein